MNGPKAEDLSQEQAREVVEGAVAGYYDALGCLVEMMRGCPYTDLEQRWAAAIGLLEQASRSQDALVLLAGAALETLARQEQAQ
jgi:hypothetical protein